MSGNVPLRAAQSCPPYLLGNEVGQVLRTPCPVHIKRGYFRLEVTPTPLSIVAGWSDVVAVTMDTGLTLSPAPSVVLVVERAYNRRERRVSVVEQTLVQRTALVIQFLLQVKRGQEVVIPEGSEVASVMAFAGAPPLLPVDLRHPLGRQVAEAHLGFFDQAYFQDKQGGPTRKYRQMVQGARKSDPTPDPMDPMVLVAIGKERYRIVGGEAGPLAIEVPLALGLSLGYSGQRVEVKMDPVALGQRAQRIESAFAEAFGERGAADLGALRYFTSYVTTHTAGDPHLFCKPALLLNTPPSWMAVLDGPAMATWEIVRGVTEPSLFGALPGVIEVQGGVHLAPGTPFLRVRPIPRSLLPCDLQPAQ